MKSQILTAEKVERLFEYLGNINTQICEVLPGYIKALADQAETDRSSLQRQIDRLRDRIDGIEIGSQEGNQHSRQAMEVARESNVLSRQAASNVLLFRELLTASKETAQKAKVEAERMKAMIEELQKEGR